METWNTPHHYLAKNRAEAIKYWIFMFTHLDQPESMSYQDKWCNFQNQEAKIRMYFFRCVCVRACVCVYVCVGASDLVRIEFFLGPQDPVLTKLLNKVAG